MLPLCFFDVSFCTVSSSVCLDIYLGLGSWVATFWERAAHLVNRVFSLSICSFDCFPFRFQMQDLDSDCFCSWSLLPFNFLCGKYFHH